jgi:twitching motility protein PilT
MTAAYSIDDLLERMVTRNASDLHLSVGAPPAMRVHGHMERLTDFPALAAEDTQQLLYRIMSSEQQKNL